MKIVGYLRTSLIEWPGKISSVIFTPGCNFACPFCHNAELASDKVSKRQNFKAEDVLGDLQKRRKWIDGVVITGGEPTLQPDLPDFVAKLKKLGFAVMLETNGGLPKAIAKIINYQLRITDYLSLDFKTRFEDYPQVVRNKNFDVKDWQKSLRLIIAAKIPFELRTTVVPTIHNLKILTDMAKFLNSQFVIRNSKIVPTWYWQSFVPKNCLDKSFLKIKSYSLVELKTFAHQAKKFYVKIKIR